MSTSVMQPFSIGVVPVIERINARLLERLNFQAEQGALWRIDIGQLHLSQPGALRIIWRIIGGPTTKGSVGVQGQKAIAPVRFMRHVSVVAEIRTADARTAGLTKEDLNLAEQVQRQLLFAINQVIPGDEAEDGMEESWDQYTPSPAQGEVVLTQRFTVRVLVHGDPYLLRTPTGLQATPELQIPPEQA